jgi:enterochelin esterase family protein
MLLPFSIFLVLIPATAEAQQAQVNLDWNPHHNAEGLAPPYGADIISPDVHPNRTVTFKLLAPEAHSVAIAPGPLTVAVNGGYDQIPFQKGEDGLWEVTIGPVAQDIYVYRLIVDGVTMVDPNNTLAGTADQPPYSKLVVHGDAPAYYDPKPVPHGAVTRHIYHSDVTGGEREMYVYTPPNYDPGMAYPVLYLVGGSGEIASNWALDGRANFIMDNLLAEGRAIPMIIAMPNNQVVHRQRPDHSEVTFDLFEAELREQIIPYVEAHYRVVTSPRGRALAGLSMGGRHTQFIGFKGLDLFGSLGILSAGHVETETLFADFLNDPDVNEKLDYLFVGQGALEAEAPIGSRVEALRQALNKHNIEHEYYAGGTGGHDWSTWRHLLYYRFLPGLWR